MSKNLLNTRRLIMKITAGLGLALLAVLIPAVFAHAQSNGLGVTPKLSFTMQAGTQATNVVYISNLNKTVPLSVHINVVDFEAQGENGAAKLLQSTDQNLTPWSLKPYITITDFVTVAPGETKQVPFTVKLPANIGAGTYYSAIEYTAATGNNQQRVNISASSATLLFINVPGQVSELMTLQDFGMSNSNGVYQSVFHDQPTYFAYRLKNSGNVAEVPAGSLVVKNIFGKTVAHVDNANPKGQVALIGQTRRFIGCNLKSTAPDQVGLDTNCTPFNLRPGLYTATLALFYGQNGQPTRQIGATAHFWVLPWTFVIEFVIAVAIIATGVYWLYRRFSHRHRRR